MDSLRSWLRLTPVAATLLTGCATLSSPPEPVQCLPPVPPPYRLMEPPESPQTRQRLDELLRPTSLPASATPKD